jgi:ABC-2 type transport system ATP-binding protein
MASTSDDSSNAKKPAARKPVTPRPAASKPTAEPGTTSTAKPVGKQAQAAARVAEEAAKAAKPIAPTASPAAVVAPAGADTPRSVHVEHAPESAPADVAAATKQPPQAVFAQPI